MVDGMQPVLISAFLKAREALDLAIADQKLQFQLLEASRMVEVALTGGHKLLACGNGGSHADAIHFCEEWTGRFKADRKPYPALALGEAAHITCTANDYGFDQVFARGVAAFGSRGDILFLLSTSGKSKNLLEAAKVAKGSGVTSIALLGRGGGPLAEIVDLPIVFPGESSDRIQELHMLSLHALIEAVEVALGHA